MSSTDPPPSEPTSVCVNVGSTSGSSTSGSTTRTVGCRARPRRDAKIPASPRTDRQGRHGIVRSRARCSLTHACSGVEGCRESHARARHEGRTSRDAPTPYQEDHAGGERDAAPPQHLPRERLTLGGETQSAPPAWRAGSQLLITAVPTERQRIIPRSSVCLRVIFRVFPLLAPSVGQERNLCRLTSAYERQMSRCGRPTRRVDLVWRSSRERKHVFMISYIMRRRRCVPVHFRVIRR